MPRRRRHAEDVSCLTIPQTLLLRADQVIESVPPGSRPAAVSARALVRMVTFG